MSKVTRHKYSSITEIGMEKSLSWHKARCSFCTTRITYQLVPPHTLSSFLTHRQPCSGHSGSGPTAQIKITLNFKAAFNDPAKFLSNSSQLPPPKIASVLTKGSKFLLYIFLNYSSHFPSMTGLYHIRIMPCILYPQSPLPLGEGVSLQSQSVPVKEQPSVIRIIV